MISAIVLAAGSSRRMGKANKLLLPFRGKSLVRETVEQVQRSGINELVVVLGHEAERIRAALKDIRNIKFVINSGYSQGMTGSIQAGIRAASPQSQGYLICLSDMPYLRKEDYNTIVQEVSGKREILVPTYRGQRGNPVFFSQHFKAALLARSETEGCRHLVREEREVVRFIAMPTDSILRDIDRPEDLPT